jgi:capsular exopolysaccharide synthesis family protein
MSQYQHVSDYARVMYKRRWIAGAAFLLVFAWSATVSLRKTPVYESGTQLLIEKESRRASSLNSVLQDADGWYDDDFYQTQYKMLQSRALAWRTLTALGLGQPPTDAERREMAVAAEAASRGGWLGAVAAFLGAPAPIAPPTGGDETAWQSDRIDAFIGGLSVAPVRNSRLVNVRYRSADPVFASRAANALADAYIAQGLSFRALASQDANSFLSTQLEEQKRKLDDSEQALQTYKEQHGAIAMTDPMNNLVARKLADISAELTRARSERLEKEQLAHTLDDLRKDPEKVATFPAVMANLTIQALNRDIADLRSRDAVLAVDYGERYSARQEIAAGLAIKQAELDAQIEKIAQAVGNEYQMAKRREEALDTQLQAQKRESLSQDNVAIGYLALERDVISNRQLYDDLLQRAKVTGVTGEYKGTNVQVIDRAEMPRVPVLPNHQRDLLFALMTGFLLAVGLAFGMEYLDSRIKTPDDIKAHLAVPFLGLIPAVRDKDVTGPSPLLERGVPPSFSEAMRGIRTSVIFSSAAEGSRTVMVTSTAPSEGKTVVTTNLGDALAQAEQRTLVIDGDMRRPRVHEVFGMAQEPGLSNVLVGAVSVQAAIRKTDNPFLSVLPAGLIPPNPAELLGSPKYRRLLEALGKDYDWIIVDAPPVMAVTDAAVISNGVGGVVFVIGSEMTPRRNAQTAIEQLTAAKAKIIGAVLNRVHVERHAYYYARYYRKDYTQAYARTR